MQPIYILQINTAFGEASISISKDGQLLHEITNSNQFDHASFLQPAILETCKVCRIQLELIEAVSVINGPGSYTGLRVGLASAKGICYALNIPLICINTLYWIAKGNSNGEADYICPMIDARRNEVFTALFNTKGETILEAAPMILDDQSYSDYLAKSKIAFVGDGAIKFEAICNNSNALFPKNNHGSADFSLISFNSFISKEFQDLAYVEPFYIKEFYTTQIK